jgi:NAD(P)-dependent dehydrogenase (short-subunit alcohol dehydrogenase family)
MSDAPLTALVTGSSRGIGSAFALRLGMAGMRVGVTARTLDPHPKVPGTIRETVEAIEKAGGEAIALQADINKPEDRARLIEEAHAALGSIDILINNAGVLFPDSVVTLTEKKLQLMYEVLVHAPLDLSQRVAPIMIEQGRGWILNISSEGAQPVAGPPFTKRSVGMYGAFKRSVEAMTTGFAIDLYEHNIAVNCLSPTDVVPTPGFEMTRSPDNAANGPALEDPSIIAEAALSLVTGDPKVLTNRIVFSQQYVAEAGLNPQPLPPLPGQFSLLS